MSFRVTDRRFGRAPSVGTVLWVLAVLAFGAGDLATTLMGLNVAGVTEVGPVAGPLFSSLGPAGVVALKLVSLVGFYGIWRLIPHPHAVGVPLGLAAVGIVVTCWNLVVIGIALPM